MRQKIIIAFFFIFTGKLQGQSRSERIEMEIDSFASLVDSNPHKAFRHIDKAYKQSVAFGKDSLIARSLGNLGYYYYITKDYSSSRKNYNKAIAYSRGIKYYKIVAYSYSQLGMMASDADQFDEALRCYLTALKYSDACRLPEIKSKTLINLGNLYMVQKDTIKGLDCYEQNIANAKQYKLTELLGQGYITIAMIYASSDKSKCLRYYAEALQLVKQNNDLATEFIIHTNLGSFYLDTFSKGHLQKAFDHIEASARIQRTLQNESLLFFVYFNYGGYYFTQKKYDQALSFYQKALNLSSKNITSDQKLSLYKYISMVYTSIHDYKSAFQIQEKFRNLNDSIFNINKNIAFNDIQTKYEVEKKNLKIALLSKEKSMERAKRKVVFVLGISVAIPLLVLTLLYRKKNKLQKIIYDNELELFVREKLQLETENELKRMSGILEGQTTERNRVASEIHDGVGGELAGIKLYLSRINASLHDADIEMVINRLTSLFQELRNISHNLSSNFLKDKDFHTVLLDLKENYESRNEFHVEIVIYPEDTFEDLSETFKQHMYRIIQELLTNVSKHAKAEKVAITITQHEDFLNVIVEDDGIGFKNTNASGIGLKNIQDRLKSLRGVLSIESMVNKGSFIIIDIPYK